MGASTVTGTFAETLNDLVVRAQRHDIPSHVALRARHATARALGTDLSQQSSMRLQRRAEAYFSACLRRDTVRGAAGSRAAARLIAAAIVDDLLEAGRDGASIWRELERGWSERIPGDLLEEYRLRLCG